MVVSGFLFIFAFSNRNFNKFITMKKLLILFLLTLLPLAASADPVEIDGIYYNLNFDEKTADVADNPNKYAGDIVIPESVEYGDNVYSVTSISDRAFQGCSDLASVTIPNSITSIGVCAFIDCVSLTSVNIPNGVTSIEHGTFSGCNSLTSLIIPDDVTSIGGYAFSHCSGLTSVTIPNSVTNIGEGAFIICSGLTSVTIGSGVKDIETLAFAGCSSLESVTFNNNGLICDYVFYECPKLSDVYCHSEKLSAYNWAFEVSYIENATLHVPKNSVDAYKAVWPWNQFKEIVALEDEEVIEGDEIKITTAGQTTWCSAYDLDFTDVEGLKAYIASGYHRTKGTIWLTRVKEVPAGEGILLIGEAGDYKVPHKNTTAYYANLMVGTVKAITLNETDGEYTNYYLSSGASGVGFYKVNGSVDLKANRAYLPLLKSTTSGSRGFIGLDFSDGEEGTTGIKQPGITNPLQQADVWYNLQGQRVDRPSRGIYIHNGKKVVIK